MTGRDCGSSICRYANPRTGMRSAGPCRCDQCPTCGADLKLDTHRKWCSLPCGEALTKHERSDVEHSHTAAEALIDEAIGDETITREQAADLLHRAAAILSRAAHKLDRRLHA